MMQTFIHLEFLQTYFITNFVNYVTILNLSHGHTDMSPELSLILFWANSLFHCKIPLSLHHFYEGRNVKYPNTSESL